jgi:hypothetical protein
VIGARAAVIARFGAACGVAQDKLLLRSSEAIQRPMRAKLDCFATSLLCNDECQPVTAS